MTTAQHIGARTIPSVRAPNSIGLCMIVKNEVRLIERCLMSVRPVISHWTIVDTGSTDGTQALIRKSRILTGVPGELHERPWKDFSSNRNEAIELATGKTSHVLVIDADDVLELADNFRLPRLTQDAYKLAVVYGENTHARAHVFRPELYRYISVLHEYLAPISETQELVQDRPIATMRIRVMGGGNRSKDPKKFVHDAETLERALEQDPENSRYVFYLAQSWRYAFKTSGDKSHLISALDAYEKRAIMGGSDEEVYIALFEAARAHEFLGHPHEIVSTAYLKAYESQPCRAEPLFYLARWLRMTKRYSLAAIYARHAAAMSKPVAGELSVEHAIYDGGALDEFTVAASHVASGDSQ